MYVKVQYQLYVVNYCVIVITIGILKGPIQLEFGNVYTGKIVELQKTGAYVLIHPQMNPVFVRNSQLDMKLVGTLLYNLLVLILSLLKSFVPMI